MADFVPGKIITFYSYKGGVGRSMILANVAWILANNGKRVLVVDWDLEAPGLHRYFAPFLEDKELRSTDGLIDFFADFVDAAVTPDDLTQDADPAWYEPFTNIMRYAESLNWEFPNHGSIDFVPAGRQGTSYATRVNLFDWQDFYERLGGGRFLEAAKERMRAEYDYILIDSRTGVSDTSGICTVQMPDALVVLFTANNQSIMGAAGVAASVSQQWHAEGKSSQNERCIFPVLSRTERAEQDKLDSAREFVRMRFAPFLEHLSAEERDRYWGRVEIPYIPYYAYEEVLAALRDDPHQRDSLLAATEQLVTRLTQGAVVQLGAQDQAARQYALTKFDREFNSEALINLIKTLLTGDRSRVPELANYAPEEILSAAQHHGLRVDRDGNLVSQNLGENIAIQSALPKLARQLIKLSPSKPSLTKRLGKQWKQFAQWFFTPSLIRYAGVLLIFSLLWTGFFDIFFLDTRIEYLTMWTGDVLAEHEFSVDWLNNLFPQKVFSDTIVLVSESEIAPDAVWGSWRLDYARLIDILSQAGAKVIGFDMSFETVSDFDAEFIRAIKEAKQRGTAVVTENADFSGDTPKIVPEIKAAVSGYGIGCIGLPAGFAGNIPLTVEMQDGKHRPSLALEIFDWYNNSIDDEYVIDRGDRQFVWNSQTSLPFSEINIIGEDWSCTTIPGGGIVAKLIINYSPLAQIRQHTIAATEVVQMELLNAASRFKNKIVLIGAKSVDDSWPISRGIKTETRYGFEIHADALSTILKRVIIRSLTASQQLLAFMFFILLGTSVGSWLPFKKKSLRISFLLILLIIYVACTIYIYARYLLLINPIYHIIIFALMYWISRGMKREKKAYLWKTLPWILIAILLIFYGNKEFRELYNWFQVQDRYVTTRSN